MVTRGYDLTRDISFKCATGSRPKGIDDKTPGGDNHNHNNISHNHINNSAANTSMTHPETKKSNDSNSGKPTKDNTNTANDPEVIPEDVIDLDDND